MKQIIFFKKEHIIKICTYCTSKIFYATYPLFYQAQTNLKLRHLPVLERKAI